MKLTNDSYVILMGTRNFTERYYRDQSGWLKISARGRKFRMTAEQVLNHLLPALAGIKPNLILKVEHHDPGPLTINHHPNPAPTGRATIAGKSAGRGLRQPSPRRRAARSGPGA